MDIGQEDRAVRLIFGQPAGVCTFLVEAAMYKHRTQGGDMNEQRFTRGSLIRAGAMAGAYTLLGGPQAAGRAFAAGFAPPKPAKLIVRSWQAPWATAIAKYAGKPFTHDTGIEVVWDYTDPGALQTKVAAAIHAGQKPPVHVLHTISLFAEQARVRKLAAPLDPTIVTNIANLLPVGQIPGNAYVNPYTYSFPIIFRPDKVHFTSAMSWDELWSPKYKGRLFVPSIFNILLYPVAKMLRVPLTGNLDKVWQKLHDLKSNVVATGLDADFIQGMKAKNFDLAPILVGDGLAVRHAGINVKWAVPREGATVSADSLYVPRNLDASEAYWAQKFVNYVIEAEHLTKWTAAVATVPTNRHSSPARFMKGDPAFPYSAAQIKKYGIVEPIQLAAKNNDSWQQNYAAALGI